MFGVWVLVFTITQKADCAHHLAEQWCHQIPVMKLRVTNNTVKLWINLHLLYVSDGSQIKVQSPPREGIPNSQAKGAIQLKVSDTYGTLVKYNRGLR